MKRKIINYIILLCLTLIITYLFGHGGLIGFILGVAYVVIRFLLDKD
jgi:hypothetical protein